MVTGLIFSSLTFVDYFISKELRLLYNRHFRNHKFVLIIFGPPCFR